MAPKQFIGRHLPFVNCGEFASNSSERVNLSFGLAAKRTATAKTDEDFSEVDTLVLGGREFALYVSPMRYQRADFPLKLDGLAAASEFFAGCFAESDPTLERIWVAHLDGEANCVHLTHHDGDETGVPLPLRTIISDAAARGSSAILLAHNHPSGDPTPSDGDKRATSRLACAAEAVDCRLVDHLVFAGGRYSSFRALGLL